MRSGKYYALSKSASLVTKQLINGVSSEAISVCAEGQKLVGPHNISDFIELVESYDIFCTNNDSTDEKEIEDNFAQKLAACSDELKIEVYDDLADLVLVDPIHEVEEESGWPKLKDDS